MRGVTLTNRPRIVQQSWAWWQWPCSCCLPHRWGRYTVPAALQMVEANPWRHAPTMAPDCSGCSFDEVRGAMVDCCGCSFDEARGRWEDCSGCSFDEVRGAMVDCCGCSFDEGRGRWEDCSGCSFDEVRVVDCSYCAGLLWWMERAGGCVSVCARGVQGPRQADSRQGRQGRLSEHVRTGVVGVLCNHTQKSTVTLIYVWEFIYLFIHNMRMLKTNSHR